METHTCINFIIFSAAAVVYCLSHTADLPCRLWQPPTEEGKACAGMVERYRHTVIAIAPLLILLVSNRRQCTYHRVQTYSTARIYSSRYLCYLLLCFTYAHAALLSCVFGLQLGGNMQLSDWNGYFSPMFSYLCLLLWSHKIEMKTLTWCSSSTSNNITHFSRQKQLWTRDSSRLLCAHYHAPAPES